MLIVRRLCVVYRRNDENLADEQKDRDQCQDRGTALCTELCMLRESDALV